MWLWPGPGYCLGVQIADSPFFGRVAARLWTQTPVWFMRQAGRSLPEYRAPAGRRRHPRRRSPSPSSPPSSTLQPVRRYGVDAAILFSDIVVPAGRHRVRGRDRARAGARSSTAPVPRRPTTSHACGPSSPRPTRPTCSRRCASSSPSSDQRPADRLRRGALHGCQLPRRRRPVADLRQDQGPHARRARAVGTSSSTAWPTWPSPRCGPRSRPVRRPSSSSTAGPGALSPADYAALRPARARAGPRGHRRPRRPAHPSSA